VYKRQTVLHVVELLERSYANAA